MGCDIHAYPERKVNGKWEYVGDVTEDSDEDNTWLLLEDLTSMNFRDYCFFGILSGVRGTSYQLYFNQLPTDISDPIHRVITEWDCDGHSHSCLTLKDACNFKRLLRDNPRVVRYLTEYNADAVDNYIETFQDIADELKALGGESQRVIFFYDN